MFDLYMISVRSMFDYVLQHRNYYVRLNHTSLLKAVLLHCGIPEDKHMSALGTLAGMKVRFVLIMNQVGAALLFQQL